MAIAPVNSSATFAAGSASSIAATATALTAGNLQIVGTRVNSPAIFVTGIADTATNLYRPLMAVVDAGNATRLELWFALNTLGNVSNTITATFSGAVNSRGIAISQYSGLATQSPVDAWN